MTVMKVLKKKVWECLQERKVVDIYLLRPSNFPQLIVEVVKVLDIGLKIPATLTQVILEVLEVGQVWPATIHLLIVDDMLIEVDLVQ